MDVSVDEYLNINGFFVIPTKGGTFVKFEHFVSTEDPSFRRDDKNEPCSFIERSIIYAKPQ